MYTLLLASSLSSDCWGAVRQMRHPNPCGFAEVPPNEVAGYGQTSETFKAREVASREPMNRYLQLRETDPEAAFEALKESFNILHDNHPKTEAYAKLFFEMHTAGGRDTAPGTRA